jgi:formate dehydrogenase subunit gamma
MFCSNLLNRYGVTRALFVIVLAGLIGLSGALDLGVSPAHAQSAGNVPGGTLGNLSDPELWRFARQGGCGSVSISDKSAGCLVQSDGENLRAIKNGLLSQFGGWLMLAMIVVLGLFYAFRGKIMIDGGPSGQTIERFNGLERFAHWLSATSFIVLALTGLNTLYGRYILKPVLGLDAYAGLAYYGKLAHNFTSFAFMTGVALMFVLWVRDNFPNRHDIKWMLAAGGLFTTGVHPPSKRFNAGQKFIFWAVMWGTLSMGVTGLVLLFPLEMQSLSGLISLVNFFGIGQGGDLSQLQQVQVALLFHGVSGLLFIALIIGHIYIGSVGMEGAIDAVGSGQVDLKWAQDHHNLWVEEVIEKQAAEEQTQPAE